MKNQQSKKKIQSAMRMVFVLTLLSLTSLNKAYAQKHEFGLMLGGATFIGDVGDNNELSSLAYFKPAAALMYRFNPNPYLGIRLSYLETEVYGEDAKSDNPHLQNRNLSFRSRISEWSIIGEFNFFKPRRKNRLFHKTPYVFLGISQIKFNPEGEHLGTWHELQPLKTEGVDYALNEWAIPFGMGYKFNLGEKYLLGFEGGWRYTFTDYLDDASTIYVEKTPGEITSDYFKDPGGEAIIGNQRANATNNDYYFVGAITFTYKIKEKINKCPKPLR